MTLQSSRSFQAKIEQLDSTDRSLWTETRRLTRTTALIPPLKNAGITVCSDEDKAELFCETLENTFRPNTDPSDPIFTQEAEDTVNSHLNSPPRSKIRKTNIHEVKWLIAHSKPRKAPGPDTIQNIVLKQLSQKALQYLTDIINSSLSIQYFPKDWKIATIIVFSKPGKDATNPSNYRPISLLNALGKLLEKIFLKRFNKFIHDNSLIRPEQFGFRRNHSTTHQLLRVVEHVTRGFNEHRSTGAVFLDIEKAFDKVWHEGLLYKLIKFGIPDAMTHLLGSYLKERQFTVRVQDCNSTKREIRAGVPQGSLLGPVLFNLYVNDLPTTLNTMTAIYADDTAFLAQSWGPEQITNRLQNVLTTAEAWYSKWRTKINVAKCEAIFFSRRKHKPHGRLTIFGQTIEWTDRVKYLGVTLDNRLNWNTHITETLRKAYVRLKLLYPILNRNSSLSIRAGRDIYLLLLRPILTYASPVWGYTEKSKINRLQVFQNKTLGLTEDAVQGAEYTLIERLDGLAG